MHGDYKTFIQKIELLGIHMSPQHPAIGLGRKPVYPKGKKIDRDYIYALESSKDIESTLEDIIEEVCPQMPLLQYKRLIEDLISEDFINVIKYHSDLNKKFLIKWIDLRALFDRLKKEKLI